MVSWYIRQNQLFCVSVKKKKKSQFSLVLEVAAFIFSWAAFIFLGYCIAWHEVWLGAQKITQRRKHVGSGCPDCPVVERAFTSSLSCVYLQVIFQYFCISTILQLCTVSCFLPPSHHKCGWCTSLRLAVWELFSNIDVLTLHSVTRDRAPLQPPLCWFTQHFCSGKVDWLIWFRGLQICEFVKQKAMEARTGLCGASAVPCTVFVEIGHFWYKIYRFGGVSFGEQSLRVIALVNRHYQSATSLAVLYCVFFFFLLLTFTGSKKMYLSFFWWKIPKWVLKVLIFGFTWVTE